MANKAVGTLVSYHKETDSANTRKHIFPQSELQMSTQLADTSVSAFETLNRGLN